MPLNVAFVLPVMLCVLTVLAAPVLKSQTSSQVSDQRR
jgi:hypothetical protein